MTKQTDRNRHGKAPEIVEMCIVAGIAAMIIYYSVFA